MTTRVNKIRIISGILGFVLVSIFIFNIWSKSNNLDDKDILLREYPVTRGNISSTINGGGTVEVTGVKHSFDTSLVIEQVHVKEGQSVRAGDNIVGYSKKSVEEKLVELNASLDRASTLLDDAQRNRALYILNYGKNKVQEKNTELQFNSNRKNIEKEISPLKRTLENLEKKRSEVNGQIKEVENSEDGKLSSNQSAKLKGLLDKKVQIEQEIEKLQNTNQQKEKLAQVDSLENQRSSLKKQLSDLNSQIDQVYNNENILSNLYRELEDIKNLINSLPEGSEQLLELLEKESYILSQISSYKDNFGNIGKLTEQKTSIEREISNLDSQISSSKDDIHQGKLIKSSQDELNIIQTEINKLSAKEEKLNSLKNELDGIEIELENVLENVSNKEESLKELIEKRETEVIKEGEIHLIQEKIDDLTLAGTDSVVESAESEVNRIRKSIGELQLLLKSPVLKAKVDGVITKINYHEGDSVPEGKPVVIIGEEGDYTVKVKIPQEDINKIKIGQDVEINFAAFLGHTFNGSVIEKNYNPLQIQDNIYYEVILNVDVKDFEILMGMTCDVSFIIKRVENVLCLSNKAIQLNNGKQIVVVKLPDGTLEEREITTGFSDGRVSEIKSGLNDNDLVVVEG